MSISSDDDIDSTEESDSKYDSEHDYDLDMRMEDDVDAPYGIVLDGNVDMEWAGDDEEEEPGEEDDEEEEDEQDEDKDEEEDEDEDDGKEPQMIGQGEMVNTLTDDVHTIVDYQPILHPELGHEMR